MGNREYKSKATFLGLPLVHVNLSRKKMTRAKGIVAVGNVATGLVAVGLFSLGGLSVGIAGLGLLSVGILALDGFSLGAVGTVAEGVRTILDTSAKHDFSLISADEVRTVIYEEYPRMWRWVVEGIVSIFKN